MLDPMEFQKALNYIFILVSSLETSIFLCPKISSVKKECVWGRSIFNEPEDDAFLYLLHVLKCWQYVNFNKKRMKSIFIFILF